MAKPNGDLILLTLAAQQHGVVTRAQLRERGLTDSMISRRVRQQILARYGPGVFIVKGYDRPETQSMGASLEFPDGVVSHFSAASLYGLAVTAPQRPQLTVPWGRHHVSANTDIRQSKHLPTYDRSMLGPVPMTTVERTIIDVLPLLHPQRASSLIDAAVVHHGATAASFISCFAGLAKRGRRGTVARRLLLDSKLAQESITASVLESRLAALLIDFGIQGFVPQFKPPWFDGIRGIVDFAHPEAKLILEADGRSWHAAEASMANDRRRDRLAAANGWMSLRFMWPEITTRPGAVADDILGVLSNRVAQRRLAA